MNFVSVEGRPERVRNELNAPREQKTNAPSVWDTQEWTDMQAAITDALQPYHDAWEAVSKGLKEHFSKYANRK